MMLLVRRASIIRFFQTKLNNESMFIIKLSLIVCLFLNFELTFAKAAETFQVSPKNFEQSLNEVLEQADRGAEIIMPAGKFFLNSEVVIIKHGIKLRGQGMDKTILSFKNQKIGAQGVFGSANALEFSDFAVEDSFGNAVKVVSAQSVAFRRLKISWTAGPRRENGAYGLYPVSSRDVLVEDCEVSDSSDAGIYVGQSENIIVRNNKAHHNVAGIEIENSRYADVYNNEVFDNTAGILVFNLPNLPVQGGRQTRVFSNHVHNNNLKNFSTPGSIVHLVPDGLGIFIMANSEVEIFKNQIIDNHLTGVAISHYAVSERSFDDPNYDPMPRRIFVRANTFTPGKLRFFDGTRMNAIVKLLLGFTTPEIIYDGIGDGTYSGKKLAEKDRICIGKNKTTEGGAVRFGNMHLDNSRWWVPFPGGPGTHDTAPHACGLDPFPEIKLAQAPALPASLKKVSAETIAKICQQKTKGVNWQALEYDCPELSDYNLFSNKADATRAPNERGFKYKLNNELFTDYAEKDRFIFLPPKTSMKYSENSVLDFPVGTIITKTFSLFLQNPKSDRPVAIETRLLVKRKTGWEAVDYLWDHLKQEAFLFLGGKVEVYEILAHNEKPLKIDYAVPNRRQCASCHMTDTITGTMSPIGPKAKFLNWTFSANEDGSTENQLIYFARKGFLTGLPKDIKQVPSTAVWSLPESGPLDQRVQAYLEINCAHCHSPKGGARNTGLYLQTELDPKSNSYGYCKRPVAAGLGSGGRLFDFDPKGADKSIVYYRMKNDHLEVKMPQLGRSVAHAEALKVIEEYANNLKSNCP